MSCCGVTIEAHRNADLRKTYAPRGRHYTFAGFSPLMQIRDGSTVLMTISLSATANGSVFSVVSDALVLTLKKADVLALASGPGDRLLSYDIVLSQGGIESWFVGGDFIVLDINATTTEGEQNVTVDIDGQTVDVTIMGGNIGIGASVLLADLNSAVEEAEASAAAAAASLDAVPGLAASAGAAAGTTAGASAGATAGMAAANAALSGKVNLNGDNISSASAWRTALGLGNSATRNVGTASGTVAAGDDARITGAAQRSSNLSDLADTLIARNNLRVSEYSTRAAAIAQSVVSSVSYIRTNGYAAAGDGGGSLYKRVGSEPSHDAKFQTADGAWWEMALKHVHPEMFGAKGDGVTDDSWPVAQAVGFASTIEFLAKNYVCTVNAWRSVRIVGQGRHYTTLTCPAATGVAVNLAASPYYLRGVTVTRSVVATAGLGIDTVANGYGTIEDVISSEHWDGIQFNATANSIGERVFARNNYNNGFVFVTSGTSESCQWKITNAVSEMNNGWGVSAYAIPFAGPDQTGPVLTNVGTYKNGEGGWVWSGGAGTAWNDVNALHCYSSFDNGPGMYFVNPGANNQFVDTFVEFASTVSGGRNDGVAAKNNASGIRIEGGARNDSALIFVGLVSMQNAIAGLVNTSASTLKTLQIQGARTVDNGRASGPDRYGIYLVSATTRTVITNLSSQGQLFTTQQYGLATASTAIANRTSVVGAVMNGNSTGPTNTATTDFAAWVGVMS